MAAAYSNEEFLLGDDFDAILDVLEENNVFEENFEEAVQEVQRQGTVCNICLKICKSQRGLKRHVALKHTEYNNVLNGARETAITVDCLIGIVNDTKIKITEREVFAKSLRDEINSYEFKISEKSSEFAKIQELYQSLVKKGNAEKFYTKYYGEVALNATKYFKGLSCNAATLLSTKLADRLINHAKESFTKSASMSDVKQSLSDRESAALQYLGGYVLQNLHKKHRNSKNCKSSENQQAMSLLSACKEEDCNVKASQKLIACLNRGGLWSPTDTAQQIFLKAEQHFRNSNRRNNKQCQKIDIKNVTTECTRDPDVVSSFNAIVSESSMTIDNSVSKDVLHCIVNLYTQVRCFSFAKDIIQKYKIEQKQVKAKALRKEILRATSKEE